MTAWKEEILLAERRNWTEDEVRDALALYLRTDFGRLHSRNPDIIELAEQLDRTPNAVALKLVNLAAIDDSIPQQGMANASKVDRQIWAEFLHDPKKVIEAYNRQAAKRLSADRFDEAHEQAQGVAVEGVDFDYTRAGERRTEATQRIGQNFFRDIVLTSYGERCALTGINDKRLLNASHILAWKDDFKNRVNPSNGICLNALHDRAFDRHLITFDDDYSLLIAPNLPDVTKEVLGRVESEKLTLPTRFLPDPKFLEQHRKIYYEQSQC